MKIPRRCSKCDKIICDNESYYKGYEGRERWRILCDNCWIIEGDLLEKLREKERGRYYSTKIGTADES